MSTPPVRPSSIGTIREFSDGMSLARTALFLVTIGSPVIASAANDHRPAHEKKEQAEKKGALKERVDPAKDLAAQRENVARLKDNVALDKKNGNHIGAWAAERDIGHAEKLERKDEKLMHERKNKKSVDGQETGN